MKKIILVLALLLLNSTAYSATKDVVPRADGEGSIGDSGKAWGNGYFDALNVNGQSVCQEDGTDCPAGSGGTVRYDQIGDPNQNSGIIFNAFTNVWTATGSSNFFTIDGSGVDFVVQADGDTQVADLTVGGGDVVLGSTNILSGGDTASLNNIDAINATTETTFEGALDLQDLQGAVTDSQVPNTITVDLATTATTANAGDSATAFFSSGTIEHERGGLEADVSAYNGLVRISSGSTSNVTNLSGLNTALGSNIADGPHSTECSTSSCNLNSATTLNSKNICLADGTNCSASGSTTFTSLPVNKLTDATGLTGVNFSTYNSVWTSTTGTNVWTSAVTTSGDSFKIVNTGNFDANSNVLKLSQTGNPTGGAMLFIQNTDAQVNHIQAPNFTVTQSGGATFGGTGTFNGTGASSTSGALTVGTTLTISGLTNCDTIDTNGSGVLSCGTDSTGGGGGTADSIAYHKITAPTTASGIYFGAFNNTWTSTTGTNIWTSNQSTGTQFTIGSAAGPILAINNANNIQIGDPAKDSYMSHMRGYTSDPCGTLPIMSYFWNNTADEPCVCNRSSVDLRVKDMSTACF